MLKQASVTQIRRGEVTRRDGEIVVAMCFYPRGLRRELRDEYRRDLAPDRKLFRDFQRHQRAGGHDAGFARSSYEERFQISGPAAAHLADLAQRSRDHDVYLVCQCATGERCHREILMLIAAREFGAKIGRIYHRYPRFLRRMRAMLRKAWRS